MCCRAVKHRHGAERRRADRVLHLLADHLQHARRRAHAHPRLDHCRRACPCHWGYNAWPLGPPAVTGYWQGHCTVTRWTRASTAGPLQACMPLPLGLPAWPLEPSTVAGYWQGHCTVTRWTRASTAGPLQACMPLPLGLPAWPLEPSTVAGCWIGHIAVRNNALGVHASLAGHSMRMITRLSHSTHTPTLRTVLHSRLKSFEHAMS